MTYRKWVKVRGPGGSDAYLNTLNGFGYSVRNDGDGWRFEYGVGIYGQLPTVPHADRFDTAAEARAAAEAHAATA